MSLEMSGTDVLYGGLFKCPFFQNSTGRRPSRTWAKRFFAFNKRNMMLQYWTSDEERIFKVEGCVRTRPRGTVSLLSPTLKVQPGEIERSMFSQKYTILIHNGPGFNGRILQLAASSADMREKWIYMINSAISNLKERQRVALIEKSIITEESDPGFKTLDNQHRVLVKKEAQLKELDDKITRSQLQCKLLNSKDKQLYEHQERLRILHREQEDKLYSLTCNETHPQRRFKYIDWCTDDVVEDMFPYGEFGTFASARLNNKMGTSNELNYGLETRRFKKNEKETVVKDAQEQNRLRAFQAKRVANTKKMLSDEWDERTNLTNTRVYPHHTDMVIVEQTGKEFDSSRSEKLIKKPGEKLQYRVKKRCDIKKHDVRDSVDADDVEQQSLTELGVFAALKDQDRRAEYNEFFAQMSRIDDRITQDDWDLVDAEDEALDKRLHNYVLRNLAKQRERGVSLVERFPPTAVLENYYKKQNVQKIK